MWAIIPIKDPDKAKQRLKNVLDQQTRKELALAMAEDVLSEISKIDEIAGIVITSTSQKVKIISEKFNAVYLNLDSDSGQSDAVEKGVGFLRMQGVNKMLTIPADIPLVHQGGIKKVISLHTGKKSIVIIPDRRREGTNCLSCNPCDIIKFHFGDNSLEKHIRLSRLAGVEPIILEDPLFSLDLDNEEDVEIFLEQQASREKKAFEILDKYFN